MDDAEGEGVLAALAEAREHLRSELVRLADERVTLEAKPEGPVEYLQWLDSEVEGTRRMLGLVEATKEELAAQGQELVHGEKPDKSSTDAGEEVRAHDSADSSCSASDIRVTCKQHTPTTALKRSRLSLSETLPQALSIPVGVWEDHLLPLLMSKDAARLGRTCKVLRGVAREHFKDLGKFKLRKLQAALTSFPRARTVVLEDSYEEWDDKGRRELLDWLCEEERGSYLEAMTAEGLYSGGRSWIHEAVLSGAVPSIKCVDAGHPFEREALTEGLLGGVQELRIDLVLFGDDDDDDDDVAPQLEALGLVAELPALAKLEVRVGGQDDSPVEWPPFIPPSLKALTVDVSDWDLLLTTESLLPALPRVLGASGAKLDRLELRIPVDHEELVEALVHVAQVLRCCPPTLKEFVLKTGEVVYDEYDDESDEYKAQVERLRVPWADVLAGVSACRELEVLVLPRIKGEPLFPAGTAFGRLTHLEISDQKRGQPPDAGVMGLWELMASGGLPALAKLSVTLEGRWGGTEEVRTRVAPALEAVAGTLTHLYLVHGWLIHGEVGMGYELGVALGKLRRLKDLALNLSADGRIYHAVVQGLAASGGERPLPLLWRLRVGIHQPLYHNIDLLASLLLPSVRVFGTCHSSREQTIVTACALRQAGYKHTWVVKLSRNVVPPPARLGSFRIVRAESV
jgi:hypothetical protein